MSPIRVGTPLPRADLAITEALLFAISILFGLTSLRLMLILASIAITTALPKNLLAIPFPRVTS